MDQDRSQLGVFLLKAEIRNSRIQGKRGLAHCAHLCECSRAKNIRR
jgi:hypothetical protein